MTSLPLLVVAVGVVLFDDRVGALASPPSPEAQDFIHNLIGFFKYMQPLMYNVPIYKYVRTPTWNKYEAYGDRVHEAGLQFVKKVRTIGIDCRIQAPVLTHSSHAGNFRSANLHDTYSTPNV